VLSWFHSGLLTWTQAIQLSGKEDLASSAILGAFLIHTTNTQVEKRWVSHSSTCSSVGHILRADTEVAQSRKMAAN
jgi:hypothetical protein